MSSSSQSTATWPEAARTFARRLTIRRRFGAFLMPLSLGLFAGAAAALAATWLAEGIWSAPWTWLAIGGAAGLLIGTFRGGNVDGVHAADAAWALDRLAGARERGLTAATVSGPRGAEAAFARPALDAPPKVRLLPPRGLAVFVGALLFALVAGVAGEVRADAAAAAKAADTNDSAGAAGTSSASSQAKAKAEANGDPIESAEHTASAAEAEAAAAARVLTALGLPDDEPVDPSELADLLGTPEQREAARDAAGAGALGEEFEAAGTSAEQMARRLTRAAEGRVRARSARRRAAGARAASLAPALPPQRRDVVERYYDRMRGAPSTSEPRANRESR